MSLAPEIAPVREPRGCKFSRDSRVETLSLFVLAVATGAWAAEWDFESTAS